MTRVASGDTAALAVLYDRHGGVMLALGLRILRSEREAEDLLHDVFVEAWQRASDYDRARGSVRSWLLLRMRSRALDRLKSPARARARPLPDDVGPPADDPLAEAGLDAARLRGILAELPDEQRTVLLLGYFEGLSSSEIAERVGVPIGTVKSRVAAAMAKIRNALGERSSAP